MLQKQIQICPTFLKTGTKYRILSVRFIKHFVNEHAYGHVLFFND